MVTVYSRRSFWPRLHQLCLLCHMWDLASRETEGCVVLSHSEISYMKDFKTHPFFNLLQVPPCLLVKPVRKKVKKVLCLIKNLNQSINNVPWAIPLIACTDPWQNPKVSQITSSSKRVSLRFHEENKIRGGLSCLPQQWKNEWALLGLFVQEMWLLLCIKRRC